MEQANERGAASGVPRWDLTAMSSAYCNVASATGQRDSVAINLGVTHGGARAPAELKVELLHRVLLTPLAAKHLHRMLGRLLGEHDAQRGGRR